MSNASTMRVHPSSTGLDPQALAPGRDLVLHLDPAHGLDLPEGVLAHDQLDTEVCWEIHDASVSTVSRCRELVDEALTVHGLCLPWLWELEIERALVPLVCHAEALRRAIERFDVDVLVLTGGDDRTRLLLHAVATATDVDVVEQAAPPSRAAPTRGLRRSAAWRRARRSLVEVVRNVGLPSRLRAGSVVFVSYWPLMPLLDRMLADRRRRPAVLLQRPPVGPARSLRAAGRGGWVGAPGPVRRARAREAARAALARAAAIDPTGFELRGMDLGAAAHAAILVITRRRAAADLATAAMLRTAFGRRRPASVVASWDVEPAGRLLVSLAREAGVRTYVLAHGAFLLPQTLADMDVCDERLLWSQAVAPPITKLDRPSHVVGYPIPHPPPPATRAATRSGGLRVLVLGQLSLFWTALDDPRVTMRQYEVAVRAVVDRYPSATIVLRPHPAEKPDAVPAILARFPDARLEVDVASPISEALAHCDLCIGTITAATLQAALAGAPVVALNLMRFEWAWPLGGNTSVPVARSEQQLAAWLERWDAGAALPGREDLLNALGASVDGGDPTDRILAIVAGESPPPATAFAGSRGSSRRAASES